FRDQKLSTHSLLKTAERLFYATDVEKAIVNLVKDTKPDIAYILHYLRKLSPSLLNGLKKTNIPIIVRISDYEMLCPQGHFFRDNHPCTLCAKGNIIHSVIHKCVQNSLPLSISNAFATWYHRYSNYFDLIDLFVITNNYVRNFMIAAGFPEDRLKLIPTFTDQNIFSPLPETKMYDYIVFSGRLEAIKGVFILIRAFAILYNRRPDINVKLFIAGLGNKKDIDSINKEIVNNKMEDRIDFLGSLNSLELANLLRKSRLSIIPSLWFENLPNSLIESYACGTAVIASDIGSLREYVVDGITGFLFNPGDASQLAIKIEYCLDHPEKLAEMGLNAYGYYLKFFSKKTHIENLEKIFNSSINN
ncbi:MAG TPA: glycosyltransferase family 4 protein, partial [Candidatus Krumholzibacteriaceae bacterium]|nr:glycosyltransferase family 4 protein [Candidatus Krumholzibacteriaceae bacterium]